MALGGGKIVITTDRPRLATDDISGTRFVRGLFDFRAIVRPENPNDLTRIRTLWLPACSAMSQSIAPLRAQS